MSAHKLPEGFDYWAIATTDDKGNNGAAGDTMNRMKTTEAERKGITNHIDVESVEEYSSKVEQLGGKVRLPKKAVPGVGYFAVCIDTVKNAFGLWKNDTSAK